MERRLEVITDTERKILAILFNAPETANDIFRSLDADDFTDAKHKKIFTICRKLFEDGRLDNFNTIVSSFSSEDLVRLGGMKFFTEILNDFTTTQHIKSLIKIIAETSMTKKLKAITEEMSKQSESEPFKIDEFTDLLEKKVLNLTRSKKVDELKTGEIIISETLEKINRTKKNKSDITGVTTGFKALDALTSGFQPGNLIILAARPGMGKTAFALNMLMNAAEDVGNEGCVYFASLEMPADALMIRILSSYSFVEITKLMNGNLTDDDMNRLYVQKENLSSWNFYIDDTSKLTLLDLQSKLRKLNQEKKLRLVVIDYLQLISSPSFQENRQQEVAHFSRTLKSLARELEVPIIAVSQLSRRVEAREHKKPLLSDLRESGAIEQDADLIMFLYRDDYYGEGGESGEPQKLTPSGPDKPMEVIIAKHRNGQTGSMKLAFIKKFGKFTDMN